MSNTITLTIELGPQTQAKLDKILEGLLGLKPNCHSCTETALRVMGENIKVAAETPTAPADAPNTEDVKSDHPVDETSPFPEPADVAPVVEPEPKAHKWTKEDLQARVQALAAPGTGKREKVRAIVKSYAEKVGDIPADKYAEVMDKLTALEQEG